MTMNNGGANESNPNRKFFLGALVLALIYYLSGLDCMQGCIREIVLVGAVLLFLYTFAGVKEFVRKRLVGLKRKPQIIAMLVLGVGFVYYSLNLTHVSNTTAYIQGTGMGLSGFVVMLFSVLSLVCFLNAFPHRKKVNIPMLVLMFLMLGSIIFCDTYYISKINEKVDNVRATAITEYEETGKSKLKPETNEGSVAKLTVNGGDEVYYVEIVNARESSNYLVLADVNVSTVDPANATTKPFTEQIADDAESTFYKDHPSVLKAREMLTVHQIILVIGALLVALLPVYTPMIRKIRTSVEVEANDNVGEIDISGEDA